MEKTDQLPRPRRDSPSISMTLYLGDQLSLLKFIKFLLLKKGSLFMHVLSPNVDNENLFWRPITLQNYYLFLVQKHSPLYACLYPNRDGRLSVHSRVGNQGKKKGSLLCMPFNILAFTTKN